MALPRGAAFFDVDETVIRVKSMFDFLRYWMACAGDDGSGYHAVVAEVQALAARDVSRAEINRRYYRQLAGPPMADLGDHPTVEQIGRWYDEAATHWVYQSPDTAKATIALAEFADLIAVDRQSDVGMGDIETDLMHQRVALAGIIGWLRPDTYREVGQKLREREPVADAA